ncbi:hypothetical protein PHAVU_010G155100 [Phaseolus vulgaris]|uniref:Uncharacterized protein n=1 Tax=Phaseolus vulgaris TaxID=3885 RepID=V7AR14_PHAVU|nr:hypothetical protein PHAVU_010G155100g [Phaseolus vulgaris]ESW07740.1 hypothetical protein PHAVU_010G155100g [Phaseolus vulgaris]
MASISQGLVFTSAMLFSTTLLYLAFSKHKSSPQFQIPSDSNKQILRSCIYSEEKKRERKKNKKRVKFAKNVTVKEVERDSKEENREEQGRQNRVSASECKRENPRNGEIPANRVALYNGILRDRGQRMACCH